MLDFQSKRSVTVDMECFFLDNKVFFLAGGRHANMRYHQPLLLVNQPTSLSESVRGYSSAGSCGSGLSDQTATLLRCICILHEDMQTSYSTRFKTIEYTILVSMHMLSSTRGYILQVLACFPKGLLNAHTMLDTQDRPYTPVRIPGCRSA